MANDEDRRVLEEEIELSIQNGESISPDTDGKDIVITITSYEEPVLETLYEGPNLEVIPVHLKPEVSARIENNVETETNSIQRAYQILEATFKTIEDLETVIETKESWKNFLQKISKYSLGATLISEGIGLSGWAHYIKKMLTEKFDSISESSGFMVGITGTSFAILFSFPYLISKYISGNYDVQLEDLRRELIAAREKIRADLAQSREKTGLTDEQLGDQQLVRDTLSRIEPINEQIRVLNSERDMLERRNLDLQNEIQELVNDYTNRGMNIDYDSFEFKEKYDEINQNLYQIFRLENDLRNLNNLLRIVKEKMSNLDVSVEATNKYTVIVSPEGDIVEPQWVPTQLGIDLEQYEKYLNLIDLSQRQGYCVNPNAADYLAGQRAPITREVQHNRTDGDLMNEQHGLEAFQQPLLPDGVPLENSSEEVVDGLEHQNSLGSIESNVDEHPVRNDTDIDPARRVRQGSPAQRR